MDTKFKLNDLLRYMLLHTGIPRIRLSSLEIREIDDELLEILTDDRICRHLHIPLQSGDDTILRAMGRTYSSSEYQCSLSFIFKKFPEISIGTDVIVGFPGECTDSFNNTVNLLIRNEFSYFHVFPYSKRENTKALNLDGHVDAKTKSERASTIRSIGDEKKCSYINRFVGKRLDVIVESQKPEGHYTATSDNYLKVHVDSAGLQQGSLISIKATGALDDHLVGIPI